MFDVIDFDFEGANNSDRTFSRRQNQRVNVRADQERPWSQSKK
jgi:hypothetical protein